MDGRVNQGREAERKRVEEEEFEEEDVGKNGWKARERKTRHGVEWLNIEKVEE